MLVAGKIKVWYDSEAIIAHAIEASGLDPSMFVVVREDVKVTQYIALSNDLKNRTKVLNERIRKLNESGELQQIVNKHLSLVKLSKTELDSKSL